MTVADKSTGPRSLFLGVERVTYPVLNLGFVISGLTPGQVGFELVEVPITMSISDI